MINKIILIKDIYIYMYNESNRWTGCDWSNIAAIVIIIMFAHIKFVVNET